MPFDREQLIRGWEYDFWANCKWLGHLDRLPDPDHARLVMSHILFGQDAWFERAHGEPAISFADYEGRNVTEDLLKSSSEKWKAFLATTDLAQEVRATRPNGTTYAFQLGDIAHHVLNHGTYHRGHLRGLADAAGYEDFDDTDWTAWLRETGQAPVV